jgi:hypothetical protein
MINTNKKKLTRGFFTKNKTLIIQVDNDNKSNNNNKK